MIKKLIPAAALLAAMGTAHAGLDLYGLVDLSYGKNIPDDIAGKSAQRQAEPVHRGGGQALVVDRRVEQRGRDAAAGGAAELHGLELLAVLDAAADVEHADGGAILHPVERGRARVVQALSTLEGGGFPVRRPSSSAATATSPGRTRTARSILRTWWSWRRTPRRASATLARVSATIATSTGAAPSAAGQKWRKLWRK